MPEYAYQPQFPYSAYLELGAQAALPAGLELEPAANAREEALIGAPSVGAPPQVVMERHEWHSGYEGSDVPFSWATCECLIERGQFAAPVESLKRAAKTLAQRWAVEQFDQARDAFRNRLYPVSFDHAQAALAGQTGQEGNRNDYRVLFLLGLLHLGSFIHRDPALLNLAEAEENFSSAGRLAANLSPTDAAWSYAAAGWAAYCRGRMDDALRHTVTALALRSKLSEAQYLAAKILVRQDRREAGLAHLAAAVAIHPTFALRALRDPDFACAAAEVDRVIEQERQKVGERALKALSLASQRGRDVGILEPEQGRKVPLPPGSGAASANALLEFAQELAMKNTLFGLAEAEVLSSRAKDVINSAAARSKMDQRALVESVRKARKAIGRLAQIESEDHLRGSSALSALAKAEELLAGTELAANAATVRDYLLNQDKAKAALTEALQTLDGCKRAAIIEADAQRARLEEELSRAIGSDVAWERHILRGAFFGFVAGLVLAMITGVSELGNGSFSSLLRLGILAFSTSVLGAIFGALVGPLNNSHIAAQRFQLETAKSDWQETIENLRRVPLGNGLE